MLPQPNWPEGHAEKVPGLMQAILHDPALVAVPLIWASGIVVAVKCAL